MFMRKTFKYRLFTTKEQETLLEEMLGSARYLYNCALEHRILCYDQWHKSINYYDQANSLKEIRSFNEGIGKLNCSASQDMLKRLDKSFKAFFRRVRRGEKPGFPRFKGKDRFDSITFPTYGDGVKLKAGKLYIQNIGTVRIRLHRDIQGDIRTVTIQRNNGKWYACFSCVVDVQPLPANDLVVGVDVGCSTFATLSNGEKIANPRFFKKSADKLAKAQRRLDKAPKRSDDRAKQRKKVSAVYNKIANRRSDFAHKVSRSLINKYQVIALEDLNIQGMIDNHTVCFGNKLNKSIGDVAWGQFIRNIVYKAEGAGRQVVLVNPRNTSKACSRCGQLVEKTLADRVHSCSCGLVLDRDINAAKNILSLGLKTLGLVPGSRLL
jgi:putative transposase